MQSYPPPAETEGLTPKGAQRAANQFRAAVLADANHPYNVGGHPQHGDFAGYFAALNAIVRQGESDAEAAASASELAEALGEDADLTPGEMAAKARELISTPDYVTGRLPEAAREKLTRKINALHKAACLQETSPPDET